MADLDNVKLSWSQEQFDRNILEILNAKAGPLPDGVTEGQQIAFAIERANALKAEELVLLERQGQTLAAILGELRTAREHGEEIARDPSATVEAALKTFAPLIAQLSGGKAGVVSEAMAAFSSSKGPRVPQGRARVSTPNGTVDA